MSVGATAGFLGGTIARLLDNTSSLHLEFQGTSVMFIGEPFSPVLSISIDEKPPFNATVAQQIYSTWYQSPVLDSGPHTITMKQVSDTGGTEVDFIAATLGNDTPVLGRTLMVDDTYDGIQYGNGWETSVLTTLNLCCVTTLHSALTFQNTTHQTSIPGSSFSFSYTGKLYPSCHCFRSYSHILSGTNMTVYGAFLWDLAGSFDLTISIDDQQPFLQTFDATQVNTNKFPEQPNFIMFTTGSLDAGNHTVTATLTRVDHQRFIIDYILYTPTFSSLATMPDLSGLRASGTPVPIPSTTSPASKKTPVGALVGGILGSVVFLTLIALVLLFLRRRKQRRNWQPPINAEIQRVDPFIPPQTTVIPPPTTFSSSRGITRTKTSLDISSNSSTTTGHRTAPSNEADADLMRELRALREELVTVSRLPVYVN
ncbi:hypothetical protein C8J56DRAFT_1058377 [Mycena floridula]|nr:hypothetical protein C8J56DRAFT_1058377 [Mycena floridula]